jgi:NAD(P)H-dependent FMN reductase
MNQLQLFAISGSLRASSRNTALLQAVQQLAPAPIHVTLFSELAQIPPFNPDLNVDEYPVLARLRDQIIAADGLIIASPEYAHGVSGVLKNALDWLVGTEAFVHKPVIMLNAAPRAQHAFAALKETLLLMSVHWIDSASVTIPVIGSIETCPQIVADSHCRTLITQALSDFSAEIMRARVDIV